MANSNLYLLQTNLKNQLQNLAPEEAHRCELVVGVGVGVHFFSQMNYIMSRCSPK